MTDDEGGGGSGWLDFLAGALVVALIGAAIYLYVGAGRPQQHAQLGFSAPDAKLNSPDEHVPSPPAPTVPPQAHETGNSASTTNAPPAAAPPN